MAKKILDTVIGGLSRREEVELSAGDKIKGELKIVHKYSGGTTSCYLRISKLLGYKKHWWGMEEKKEEVYSSPDISEIPGERWDVSFEAIEDGKYIITIDTRNVYVQVQLYLEKAQKDVTVPYDGS